MSARVSVATAVNLASLQDRNVVAGPGAAVGPICRLVRYVGGAVRMRLVFIERAEQRMGPKDEWWATNENILLLHYTLRQTVHTHCASVHQAAKLVAALLRGAWVTAGLAESNGSLSPGL